MEKLNAGLWDTKHKERKVLQVDKFTCIRVMVMSQGHHQLGYGSYHTQAKNRHWILLGQHLLVWDPADVHVHCPTLNTHIEVSELIRDNHR